MSCNRARVIAIGLLTVSLSLPSSALAQSAYEAIDYGGDSIGLGDINWVGDNWNDRISSVTVDQGWKVILYEHIYYGGASLELAASTADLSDIPGPGPDGTWNDVASSLRYMPISTSVDSYTYVINGTSDSNPSWIQPGDPFMQAIAATYGKPPIRHQWSQNSPPDVTYVSAYNGIRRGAEDFRDRVNSDGIPSTAQLNVVGFSHGGNVAHIGASGIPRLINHMVTLATPIPWDLRAFTGMGSYQRFCAAWSWDDLVQMPGSSLAQQAGFAYASWQAAVWIGYAWDSWLAGNESQAFAEYAVHLAYVAAAEYFWRSTRHDFNAANFSASGLSHSDLHRDFVWNALPAFCKTQ